MVEQAAYFVVIFLIVFVELVESRSYQRWEDRRSLAGGHGDPPNLPRLCSLGALAFSWQIVLHVFVQVAEHRHGKLLGGIAFGEEWYFHQSRLDSFCQSEIG